MKKAKTGIILLLIGILITALPGCSSPAPSSSAAEKNSSAYITSSEAVVVSGESREGLLIKQEELEKGGIWYLTEKAEAVSADTPLQAVLYFSKGGLLVFRMDDLPGKHILSDFVTREDAQIVDSLRKEREEAFASYALAVADRLAREQEALRSEEGGRTRVELSPEEDTQLLWQLSELLMQFAPSNEGFLAFMSEYFTGEISKPAAARIVIEQSEKEWRGALEAAIAEDEALLDFLHSSPLTAPYEIEKSGKGSLVIWQEKWFNKAMALNDRSALLLPSREGEGDIRQLISYLKANQQQLEVAAYSPEEILFQFRAGARPVGQTGSALREGRAEILLEAAWDAPAENRSARNRLLTGYTGGESLLITAEDIPR